MSETDRARYSPQHQPIHGKTEAGPSQQPARIKTETATPTALTSTQHSTSSVTTTDNYGQKHFQLAAMFKDATPQVLESAVDASVKLLDTLRAPIASKMENSPDAEHWIQQIDNIKKLAVKTKTVIGVVGNTGAGKSSVINAMLEEERLVPTNCMRACTVCRFRSQTLLRASTLTRGKDHILPTTFQGIADSDPRRPSSRRFPTTTKNSHTAPRLNSLPPKSGRRN